MSEKDPIQPSIWNGRVALWHAVAQSPHDILVVVDPEEDTSLIATAAVRVWRGRLAVAGEFGTDGSEEGCHGPEFQRVLKGILDAPWVVLDGLYTRTERWPLLWTYVVLCLRAERKRPMLVISVLPLERIRAEHPGSAKIFETYETFDLRSTTSEAGDGAPESGVADGADGPHGGAAESAEPARPPRPKPIEATILHGPWRREALGSPGAGGSAAPDPDPGDAADGEADAGVGDDGPNDDPGAGGAALGPEVQRETTAGGGPAEHGPANAIGGGAGERDRRGARNPVRKRVRKPGRRDPGQRPGRR